MLQLSLSIRTEKEFKELLIKLLQTENPQELRSKPLAGNANVFLVTTEGKTYLNPEKKGIPNTESSIPNRPLFDAFDSIALRKLLLSSEPLTEEEQEDVRKCFACPISFEITVFPTLIPSGYGFDYGTIFQSIQSRPRDPFTRNPLTIKNLINNFAFLELLFLAARKLPLLRTKVLDELKILQEEVLNANLQQTQLRQELLKNKRNKYGVFVGICAFYFTFISTLAIPDIKNKLYNGDTSGLIGVLFFICTLISSAFLFVKFAVAADDAAKKLKDEIEKSAAETNYLEQLESSGACLLIEEDQPGDVAISIDETEELNERSRLLIV